MHLQFTEEQLMIQKLVRDFAKNEIAPFVEEMEKGAFPTHLLKKLGELGLMGITAPSSLGGADMDFTSYIIAINELSKVSATMGVILSVHTSVGTNPIIYDEYRKDLPDFFQSIWWPNMIKVASKYDITYTGAIIQTYNDNVTPPFVNDEEDTSRLFIRFGREIIQNGGELGYHGYNHQSLTTDETIAQSFGYNAWENKEHMIAAINELNRYTSEVFPTYNITSYVPPSNVLSETGREALVEAIPTLMTINSLYGEDGSNRAYIQEYNVGADGIINMPRISSGYFPTETNEWAIANAINLHGTFSHFIHPDDVISHDRSMGSWSEMYEKFEHFMRDIQQRYFWLRPLKATKAATLQVDTLNTQISFEQNDHSLIGHMLGNKEPQHFILRLSKEIKNTSNCTVEKIDDNTYLVIVQDGTFEINY